MSRQGKLKNVRHELFVQGILAGKTQQQAVIDAGYSPKSAPAQGTFLIKNTKIKERLQLLIVAADGEAIMSVKERKERLSEIARARLVDFVEVGADGAYISAGLESLHSAALQEVISTTKYNHDSSEAAILTRLKLHDPVKAMAELNHMEGQYAPLEIISKEPITINLVEKNRE